MVENFPSPPAILFSSSLFDHNFDNSKTGEPRFAVTLIVETFSYTKGNRATKKCLYRSANCSSDSFIILERCAPSTKLKCSSPLIKQ